jgi:hypothetical protein
MIKKLHAFYGAFKSYYPVHKNPINKNFYPEPVKSSPNTYYLFKIYYDNFVK